MNKLTITSIYLILSTTFLRCSEIVEPDLSNIIIKLLSPANNILTKETSQTFYWEPIPEADKYQLQVVSPGFDSIAVLLFDTIITKNQFKVNVPPGTYQWKVKCLNQSTTSQNSEIWNLTIE